MSQSADAAIDRWYDIVRGHTTRGPLRASNILVQGDLLYSYGTHFELARPLRDKKGEVTAYLLNGDTYSVTTSSHQSHVRQRLGHEQTVIVPHSALNSAGLDLNSIKLIHVKDDTWVSTEHSSETFPESAKWHHRDIYERQPKSDATLGAELTAMHRKAIKEWADHRRYYHEAVAEGREQWRIDIWASDAEKPMPTRPTRRAIHQYNLDEAVKVGVETTLWTRRDGRGEEITIWDQDDGSKFYTWTTRRHWLGEALIRARVTWFTQETCPNCGGKGLHPGLGDDWDVRCRRCSQGWSRNPGMVPKEHHRWSYYLSGFDHEEARPLYFFAELPRSAKPTTVAEAYEALKPEPVKMAEQMNRPVFRQGDIFGVPMEAMDLKALKALNARIVRRGTKNEFRELQLPYVLNTNHTATEVAYLPGGVTLARGTMYHDPEGRRADHARRRLGDGKTWHVVIKNTVPIAARR